MSQPAVLFGGPSPEHDVSILAGLPAARALMVAGAPVHAIYWTKTGDWFAVDPSLEAEAFVEGAPKGSTRLQLIGGAAGGFVSEGGGLLGKRRQLDVSVVVNCCHGGPGEDGTLQAALDLAGLRYTGPSVAGAALGMDKLAFASVAASAGLPHLPCVAATADLESPGFDGPYIVKPRFGGSSIGIEVIEDWESVVAFLRTPQPLLRAGAVVEPFRADAVDLNIAVRRYPDLQLSAIERPLRATDSSQILNYRDKYLGGEGMVTAPKELPADIPEAEAKALRGWATAIAGLAMVRGVARIDFLRTGGELYVNEINTVPGSLARHLWVEPEIPFATLLADMIAEAESTPARHYSVVGADGTVLRSAGSISAKLA